MATIKFNNIDELKICLQNAKDSDDIFNHSDVEHLSILCSMLDYAGEIMVNNLDFEIMGRYS